MLHYASQLANALSEHPAYEVTVVLPMGNDTRLFNSQIKIVFVPVIKNNTLKDFLLLPLNLLRIPLFLARIKATRPAIIHLNNCHVWYFFTLPFLKRKFPILATVHDITPHPGADDTFRKRKEINYIIRQADQLFVHGARLKKALRDSFPTREKSSIHSIPHGDYNFINHFATNPNQDSQDILFFGRIRAYKGIEVLLKAAYIVMKSHPKAKFVIAGNGDFSPYAAAITPEMNLQCHIRYLAEEEIAHFFQQAQMVILPYTEASQSGVIPIAYAFEKPVVASAVGSIPEVVHDHETGLLVPPNNAQALAEAIVYLLDHPDQAKAYGIRGSQLAKTQLSWEKVIETTTQAYQQQLSST